MQEFQKNLNSMSIFDNVWEKISDKESFKPDPRSGHSSVVYQSQTLYVFGGYNDREALNDMLKFDLNSYVWEPVNYKNKDTETPSSTFPH